MTTYLTIQPDPSIALDLSVDGNDVEVTTREADAFGVVVRLPRLVLRAALDGLETEEESDGSYTRTDEPVAPRETVEFWQARWKEAADQRDARDGMATLWKEVARRLNQERWTYRSDAKFEEARADGLGRAHRECHRQRDVLAERCKDFAVSIRREQATNDRLRAEQPRPVTATDEMVERARDAAASDMPKSWWGGTEWWQYATVIITAALTEPTRLEWEAESAERITGAVWGVELPNDAGETGTLLAARLARHGYKVVPVTGPES